MSFSKFGAVLATRPLGARVRKEIMENLGANEKVVFDLSGVEMLSNSFADECFAKLLFEMDFEVLKRRTTFRNSSLPIQHIISYAMKARSESMHSV